jgi:hypothetical protein
MTQKNLNFLTCAVLTASVAISSVIASAEDLPQTKAHQQLSVTQGFKQPVLEAFERKTGGDPRTVSVALLEKLGAPGAYQSSASASRLSVVGADWSLEVSGDSSAAEYQNLAVAAQAHALAKPLSAEMSAAELEQRGRAFIAANLASEIVLGSDEELVALRVDYRTEGGQDAATGVVSQAVVANRIVFSRMVHGIPVVGNGSKVILTFTNDGSLESFRYDWPTYQVASSQSLVDAGEILSRVQKVVSSRAGVAAPRARVAAPSNTSAPFPVELTANTKLQALDCGYYDAGFRARQSQSVQPGCTYLAVSQDASGARAGYSGAVPAGAQFTSDATWRETQILNTN